MTEATRLSRRVPTAPRMVRLEDGRPVSVEALVAEARREQSAAIRRLGFDLISFLGRIVLSLVGPAFGWHRSQLAELQTAAAMGRRHGAVDNRHRLSPADFSTESLYRGDAALGHVATARDSSSETERTARKSIAA
ncbi:hypothetical protein DF3PA_60068 [Candidatus Defluviicoccus seviourii]|uniref:Uncharacterized protein n=1 Tax=Candidatus Defluviicoccus seviourii TaxID=2565273 RepID=A0A564WHK2_9PROT|nr:hypothetical protein DF3PA_60068 [Candidatus Defluviicoccus seviourii]